MNPLQRYAQSLALPGALVGMVLVGLTGAPSVAGAQGGLSYSAYVHAGDCASFSPETAMDQADATLEAGAGDSLQSLSFALEADAGMADLIATPHAITIEAMDADVATVVACGEIVGVADAARLVTPMLLTNSEETGGVAVITPTEAGSTEIEVFAVFAEDVAITDANGGDDAVLNTQDDGSTPEADDDSEPEGGV